MKRIIVKMKDAKEKIYAPNSFFDAMHFAIDNTNHIYCKNYYGNIGEGNLMERHITVLNSIPINFSVEQMEEGK